MHLVKMDSMRTLKIVLLSPIIYFRRKMRTYEQIIIFAFTVVMLLLLFLSHSQLETVRKMKSKYSYFKNDKENLEFNVISFSKTSVDKGIYLEGAAIIDDVRSQTKIDRINENSIQKRISPSSKMSKSSACSRWVMDYSNWTLKYLDIESRQCFPSKLTRKIKRVILPNGTEIYCGCTQKTHKCREQPHFDKERGVRINTPPCCLKHVLEIFQTLTEALTSHNVAHFMNGGGLIGWYRNRNVVPYDHDLDILIDLHFWRTWLFRHLLNEIQSKYHYKVVRKSWNKIKVYYSGTNRNFVDLWPFKIKKVKEGDYVKPISSQWKMYHASNVLPLQRTKYAGFWTWIPRNPNEVLDREYGVGKWKKELSCKKIDRNWNCV